MSKPNPSLALGILGGGQLARMLALRAHELGIEARVLSESEADPAAQVARLWTRGSLSNSQDLEAFLKRCHVATFESEFLDARLLGRLAPRTGCAIYPRPAHMAVIQDRLTQKRLLQKHRVPTAPFRAVSTMAHARAAWEEFAPAGGMVVKKRRFGYDGYGTFMVRTREELEALRLEIESNQDGFIAERLVPFRREAAVMIVRGRIKGASALSFPLVETRQENARCLWAKGPLRLARGKAIVARLKAMADRIGYVGALGAELFDVADGLLVNELAPRVHNSGHYSMDALEEDQFTAHVKATMGLALSTPKALAPGFAMHNLLGDEPSRSSARRGDAGQAAQTPARTIPPGIALHWYGKAESRPGRKMGHMNALGPTPESALRKLAAARKTIRV